MEKGRKLCRGILPMIERGTISLRVAGNLILVGTVFLMRGHASFSFCRRSLIAMAKLLSAVV